MSSTKSLGITRRTELSGLPGSSTSSKSDTLGQNGPWKKRPTMIAAPTARPINNVHNPFSAIGNPNRKQVIFTPTDSRPQKRARTESRHFNSDNITTSSLVNGRSFKGRNPPSTEEIIHEDEGEDIGASTSFVSEVSDELNLHGGNHLDTNDVHMLDSIEVGGINSKPTRNARSLPMDGPSTERLREKTMKQIADSSIELLDSDGIEEVEGPISKDPLPNRHKRKRNLTPKRETVFLDGHVGRKIQQFEPPDQPQAGPSKRPEAKLIDLKQHQSKVQKMKSKNAPRTNGVLPRRPKELVYTTGGRSEISTVTQNDPIATSSTKFIDSEKWEGRELPLERWIWGDVVFSDNAGSDLRYSLRICKSSTRLELRKTGMDNCRKYLYWNDLHNYEMQFTSIKPSSGQFDAFVHLRPENDCYDPITLRFSRDCSQEDYNFFLTTVQRNLYSSPTTLVGTNIQACWDSALQIAKTASVFARHSSEDPDIVETEQPAMAVADTAKLETRAKSKFALTSVPSKKPIQTYTSAPRRSSRNVEAAKPKDPPPNPDELILVYPFSGPGAVNVTNGDLGRLEPSQYLNDTLIELWLKLMMNDLRHNNPELADEVHVFSSFFYKKLSPKNPEKGYESVRKWTARIDLFKKKYIIIPINENVHWYLAIIYRPEHILLPPPPKDPPPPPPSTRQQSRRLSKHPSSTSNVTEEVIESEGSVIVQENTKAVGKTVTPSEDEDDPIEDADNFEDSTTTSTPIRHPSPVVIVDNDVDEDMVNVTQRTHECSIDPREEDATEEQEVSMQLGHMEGGGPGPGPLHEDDDTVADSEPEREIVSSPLTPQEDTDEEEDQLADDNCDPMTVDEVMTGEASGVASDVDMDVEPNGVNDTSAAASSGASSAADVEESVNSGNPGKEDDIDRGVSSASFYSTSAPQRPRREIKPFPMDVVDEEDDSKSSKSLKTASEDDVEVEGEEGENIVIEDKSEPIDLTDNVLDDKMTYIFTMDSLGSGHTRATRVLGDYLRYEAKDKKGVENTSPSKGKVVDVPTQPNYCDCGLYLLHFAETFLSDPERLAATILQTKAKKVAAKQRTTLWKGEKVESMRERMMARIKEESARWKEFRAQKQREEDEKKKEAGAQPAPQEESSDDDVVIQGYKAAKASPPKRKPKPQIAKKRTGGKAPRKEPSPAESSEVVVERMRG